jgi:hypothetical protein
MTTLTRELVSKSNRFEMVEVDVTEWGEIDPETNQPQKTTVFVRELTARAAIFRRKIVSAIADIALLTIKNWKPSLPMIICSSKIPTVKGIRMSHRNFR